MMKESEVIFKRQNDSSTCMLFVVAIMLVILSLLMVLPPILNQNKFPVFALKPTDVSEEQPHYTETEPTHKVPETDIDNEEEDSGSKPKPETPDVSLVHTPLGSVRGIITDGVRAFHGVPYAQPPVGKLRWRYPQEVSSWAPDVYNAVVPKPGCPQKCDGEYVCPAEISEDCLYLEIFTPIPTASTTKRTTELLPVIVFIHGGSFSRGSPTAPFYNPTHFVQRANVIFVGVAYRLGALGFLATGKGPGNAKGNYGLYDQVQALKWVQENIESFGGDPDKVTLMGHSSGAQSALLIMASDNSKDYFRNVILGSPPIPINFKTYHKVAEQGTAFAEKLNCNKNTSSRSVDMQCLRSVNVENVLVVQTSMTEKLGTIEKIEYWGPVIDQDLVRFQLMPTIKRFSQRTTDFPPMIWGTTSQEAVPMVYKVLTFSFPSSFYGAVLENVLGESADVQKVVRLYPSKDDDDVRDSISQIATDYIFRCPAKSLVETLSENGASDIWMYSWEMFLDVDLPGELEPCTRKVCHGLDLLHIFKSFNYVNPSVSISPEAEALSNRIVDYFANFIRTGNPNIGQGQLTPWPSVYSKDDESMATIRFKEDGSVESNASKEDKKCDFFDDTGYNLME